MPNHQTARKERQSLWCRRLPGLVGTHSKGSRGIPCRSPAPAAIQTKPFIADDPENTAPSEGLWICLPLDLQDVEREQDNLADADETLNR